MNLGKKAKWYVEECIFNVRWLLLLFYAKLVWDLIILAYLAWKHNEIDPNVILKFIEDVDVTMIANLIEMMITGGYNSFVSKDHGYKNKNISSGQLKVKMGTSIIGISSIHLLRVFIGTEAYTMPEIWKKVIIHGAFIIGGLTLALIDYWHEKLELKEKEHEEHLESKHSDPVPRGRVYEPISLQKRGPSQGQKGQGVYQPRH